MDLHRTCDLLNGLIKLDFDAIEAYEAALRRLDGEIVRTCLVAFLDDHRRHTRDLSELVRQFGGTPATVPGLMRVLIEGAVGDRRPGARQGRPAGDEPGRSLRQPLVRGGAGEAVGRFALLRPGAPQRRRRTSAQGLDRRGAHRGRPGSRRAIRRETTRRPPSAPDLFRTAYGHKSPAAEPDPRRFSWNSAQPYEAVCSDGVPVPSPDGCCDGRKPK